MLDLTTTPELLALAVCAGAGFTDALSGHIPNWLTLPPLAAAPTVYLVTLGPRAAAFSLLAAIVCALVPYLMFRKGAAGGGDVKLLAAVGALAGASFGIETTEGAHDTDEETLMKSVQAALSVSMRAGMDRITHAKDLTGQSE